MLIDEALHEARRLQASLRAMVVDNAALEEADLLCRALGHDPVENVVPFVLDTLERIDALLPAGTLAGLVSVRIRNLIGTLQVLRESSFTAEDAISVEHAREELDQAARNGTGAAFLSPAQAWAAWKLAIPVECLQRPLSPNIAAILDAVSRMEVTRLRRPSRNPEGPPIEPAEVMTDGPW